MIKLKKYKRVFEKRLPVTFVKRTPLSGYEYFSERFRLLFQNPEYSTVLAHFDNYNKELLSLHCKLPNELYIEAITGRWLKLPPHNLTFIAGPVLIIYGKYKPLDILKQIEKNQDLLENIDQLNPYLIIHKNTLIAISDLVNYNKIVENLELNYMTTIKDVFLLCNRVQNKTVPLFIELTSFFSTIIKLLKTKIDKNGNSNTT